MSDAITPEQAQAAKDVLAAAIAAYEEAVEPGVYVSGWVLVTHKESIELERANQSAVGRLEPTGQSWPLTVGMLTVALDDARSPWEDLHG